MAKYLTLLISAIQLKKRSAAKRRGRGRGRGRVRRRQKVEIPLDLQIEILSRLPAKSLMRFKCVSKLWSCLIRSRYFTNLYLTVAAASPLKPPRVYMSMVEHTACDSMEVCHNPGKSLLVSLSSSSSSSLEPDLSLTMQGMGGHKMMILRGLMLYIVCRKACIYNPTTRQSVTLPAIKSIIFAQEESHENFVYYFLGHDSVLDQYKVICIVVTFPDKESGNFEGLSSEHWVFTLEAGGCWKKIEFDQPPPHVPTSQGLCINGVIYYLASTHTCYQIFISFDVRSEEFNMIRSHQLGLGVGFIEYGGKPTIFDHTYLRYGLVDLWVLEEVEDGGRWSKKPLVLQPCQMHLLYHDDIVEYVVEYITQNNEVVLGPRPMPTPPYFLYYHLQNNDLRKVNVTFLPRRGFCWGFKEMDKSENIMHLET